jgi:hypothetical protein
MGRIKEYISTHTKKEVKDAVKADVKKHVGEHKVAYSCAATGVVVAIVTVLVMRGRPSFSVSVAPVIAPVFNNNNSSSVNLGGYAHKLVQCDETKEIWPTVTDAAKAAGVATSVMSRCLNGHKEHIYGNHYKIIGVGTLG